MPGGSKTTVGFTKAAQKKKFVRNRDIKLKESELNHEAKIKKSMCEGSICQRCRDKVQWKFKYDKYKPLRVPGTCQSCRQKTIVKAYRTFCETCATQKKVCSGCGGSTEDDKQVIENNGKSDEMEVVTEEEEEETETIISCDDGVKPIQLKKSTQNDDRISDDVGIEEENDGDEEDAEEIGKQITVGSMGVFNKDSDMNVDNDIINQDTSSVNVFQFATSTAIHSEIDSQSLEDNSNNMQDLNLNWNEKKYQNVATAKYSKSRKVGSVEDITYSQFR